jgi:hypothetical protein
MEDSLGVTNQDITGNVYEVPVRHDKIHEVVVEVDQEGARKITLQSCSQFLKLKTSF